MSISSAIRSLFRSHPKARLSRDYLKYKGPLDVMFPLAGGSGDPHFANVVLLQHFDSTLADVKGHTVTAFGGMGVSGGAAVFDGVNDYYTVADSPDWLLTNTFTIEWEAYFTSTSTYSPILTQRVGPNDSIELYINSSKDLLLNSRLGGVLTTRTRASALPAFFNGSTHNFAVCFSPTASYVFMDGVPQAVNIEVLGALPDMGDDLKIGTDEQGTYFNGSIKRMRITKGVCRHTADYSATVADAWAES